MRQIASQSGIALGGLYNHFSSKEEVFQAVFFEYHPYHEVLPALLSAPGDSVEELVQNAADRLLKALDNRPDFLNLMFIEIVEFNSTHMAQLFTTLLPQALQVVQRFQQVGRERLRPIPPAMLIRSFLGLFFSYYITEKIIAPRAPTELVENAMDHFVDIYLHGILFEG
jgi:AcrR family transcriptional regulator